MKTFEITRRRGFGLIDVSLGIIAGLGLLVGAVILFQQVNTNNAVSEITRNAVSISSEIRAAARNLPAFDDLAVDPGTDDSINLVQFGLEPALLNNPDVDAEASGQTFSLTFTAISQRACDRAAVTPANLGSNVTGATCAAPGTPPVPTLTIVYGR